MGVIRITLQTVRANSNQLRRLLSYPSIHIPHINRRAAESSQRVRMAILCASSSSSVLAVQKHPILTGFSGTNPFLGVSFAVARPVSAVNAKRSFGIQCEKKNLSIVPLDQRWMFEESEVGGPVSFSRNRFAVELELLFLFPV